MPHKILVAQGGGPTAVINQSLAGVALGGIEPDNVQSVRSLPVAGVAVIRAISSAIDPSHATRLLSRPVTSS